MKLKVLSAILALGIAPVASARMDIEQRSELEDFDFTSVVAKANDSVLTVGVMTADDAEPRSNGTAIIVSRKGYALTAEHVVSNATKVVVYLVDGTAIDAEVAASSPAEDLALLKLHIDVPLPAASLPLKVLDFGTARAARLGESVVVIGDPYGYRDSISFGIVSGLGRDVTMPSGAMLKNIIQFDAAINPGNSGGPLLAADGTLLGLVFAIYDGAQGIAFAHPRAALDDFLLRHLDPR